MNTQPKYLKTALVALLLHIAVGNTLAQNKMVTLPLPQGAKIAGVNTSGNGSKTIVYAIADGKARFYEMDNNAGKFSEPIENLVLNSLADNNMSPCYPSYNVNATEIYFSADMGSGNQDLYVISKTATGWSEPTKLGYGINTNADEIMPSISGDGCGLIFIRKKTEDAVDSRCGTIYYVGRQAGQEWGKPEELVEPINLGCETSPYFAPDSKSVYIASQREGGVGGYDLYFAKRNNSKVWILPVLIDSVNTSLNELFPAVDVKNNMFYFYHEDKKAALTGLYSNRIPPSATPEKVKRFYGKITDLNTNKPIDASIKVTDPVSHRVLSEYMVDKVTGMYDFYLLGNDKVILDFCAPNYSHTFVDTDLSTIKEEKKQDVALFPEVNLVVNIYDKDMFEPLDARISILCDGKKIDQIKPNKEKIGRYNMVLPIGKNYDIKIENPLYDEYIIDLDLSNIVLFKDFERDAELIADKELVVFDIAGADVPVDIEITDLSTNEKYRTSVTTDENGKAKVYLRKGDKYEINIAPKGYSYYNTVLDLDQKAPAGGYKVAAMLEALKEDARLELKDITFETNSADLNLSSFDELDRLVELLKQNPNIKVEVSAHTDDKGADDYNLKLSDRRAASVAEYLQGKGIDFSRLVTKGYGKSKPLVPNTSDENRAKNRRVELKVLGTN